MDNTTYVALSQLTALERQLDVTANNIANANSAGFKAERVLFESYLQNDRVGQMGGGTNYVLDRGSYLDDRQGSLIRTDNPLNVALSGEGWFGYETENGQEAYGRDGRFVVDAQGRLMTVAGAQVKDIGGGPITLPPDAGSGLEIAPDGSLSVNGAVVARLGVFTLNNLQSLERIGNGMLVAGQDGIIEAEADEVTQVLQGHIEGSNVEAVTEVTRLLAIQQAYQKTVNLINAEDEIKRNMLGRIGRPQI